MKLSRRKFMKIAGVSAAGLTAAVTGVAPLTGIAAEEVKGPAYQAKGLTAKRWGMAMFVNRLQDPALIKQIAESCHKPHNVPNIPGDQEIKWIWADSYAKSFPDSLAETAKDHNFEDLMSKRFLLLCNHCENPACTKVCPTGATFKREDGIVVMDPHRCMGCRYCMVGCPYGARSFNFHNPSDFLEDVNQRYPRRMRGVVEKCNFCTERLAEGKLPYCVEASDGAIVFGDLGDRDSEISKLLRENYSLLRKPSLGTGPNVYYII
ncbi:4Fe-4S dicluster domain-containing protein [Desulfovibrio sp. OttesenSCG-928-C06]|nr:4Fe-4S dicluster domain-containing protein [Desulfovibrio sp. OttesenSCG-928-C06]